MDSLDFQNNTENTNGTTGLETEASSGTWKDPNWWKNTISSGLGIMGNVTSDPVPSASGNVSSAPTEKKILGMPRYVVMIGGGVLAITAIALIIRKNRAK